MIFRHRTSGSSVRIEDDGRVAYAYFLSPENEIVGDVWLYNRCRAPAIPEWNDKDKAPFANPSDYAHESPLMLPPNDKADVSARWSGQMETGPIAEIFVRDVLIARLCAGAKPGWSIAAKRDGPLAKTLPMASCRS